MQRKWPLFYSFYISCSNERIASDLLKHDRDEFVARTFVFGWTDNVK
ncbi:hypothetical protein MKZ27_07680 [Bacillus sp. FSL R5-0394]|nr:MULTISPECIES: hypothetical protein [Shouchella]MCM3378927.1 hypothetical protein [Shouchella rhizosphaerae]